MSDVSILSHEYKTTSELSQAINTNLIVLKKVTLGLPGAEKVNAVQFAASRYRLAELVETLVSLLDLSRAKSLDTTQAAHIPGAFVERLRKERRGDLAYYLQDLEDLATRLRADPPQLTSADFAVLDHLAAIADAETSGVFRQMMRR
jgi:hypothetical protein